MENNQRNSRKRLNSLILLVAFTAVMLIVSTYAWFSTQRNVTLSGLKGIVKVAEGLQVSLDAKHWVNAINFEDFEQTSAESWTVKSNATTTYLDSGNTFQLPAGVDGGITNVVPTDYLPVSTTGASGEGIGQSILKMYKGIYTDSEGLKNIGYAADDGASPTANPIETSAGGYFAFDLYLMNTSSGSQTSDKLQLDPVSDVTGVNEATGIQNTIRIGLAVYGNAGETMKIGQSTEPDQAAIIAGTSTGRTITDVAIWEPNADKHVTNIVNSNSNTLKLTSGEGGDQTLYGLPANAAGISKFDDGNILPTYALTAASKAAGSIAKVYDWTQTDKGLEKQKTTQTTAYASADDARSGPIDLKSVSNGSTSMTIVSNQYQKLRVYVWIEGQDPDCINYASLGQGLTLNLGLSKPESNSSASASI